MLISIIVPVYNVSEKLSRCIESILNQEYNEFELILVNDGSTDNSGDICNKYAIKDNRIKVIHKKNKGVSKSRNIGIEHAKGKYIVFVDSDDYINTNMTLHLKDIIEKEKNPDWILWGFNKISEDGIKIDKVSLEDKVYNLNNKIELYKNIESKTFGYVWTAAFKSEIIKNNNITFNEEISLMEDLIFTYKYFEHCKRIITTSKIEYNYIKYNSSTTLSKNKYINIFEIFLEVIECKRKALFDMGFERSYIDRELFNLSLNAVNQGIDVIYRTQKGRDRIESVRKVISNRTIDTLLYKNKGNIKNIRKIRITDKSILSKNIFLINIVYIVRNIKIRLNKQ